jgi:hypothetical protein
VVQLVVGCVKLCAVSMACLLGNVAGHEGLTSAYLNAASIIGLGTGCCCVRDPWLHVSCMQVGGSYGWCWCVFVDAIDTEAGLVHQQALADQLPEFTSSL